MRLRATAGTRTLSVWSLDAVRSQLPLLGFHLTCERAWQGACLRAGACTQVWTHRRVCAGVNSQVRACRRMRAGVHLHAGVHVQVRVRAGAWLFAGAEEQDGAQVRGQRP